MLLTRTQFIRRSAIVGAALAAPGALRTAPAVAQGTALRKFIVPLPVPGTAWPVVTADGAHLVARQFAISVHPDLPPTTVWGYRLASGHPATPATYLGPTLVASPGTPANVTFTNGLAGPLFPADPMLIPAGVEPAAVRLNTHQHGGRIDDQSDGNPFVAYTGGREELESGDTYTLTWSNDQGAALAIVPVARLSPDSVTAPELMFTAPPPLMTPE